jgi:hypothetical protein
MNFALVLFFLWLQDQAPDVVYSFKSASDVDATISTCGSGYDTKLIVSTNLSDTSTYLCNDDDRTCASNTACSKLDVLLKVPHTDSVHADTACRSMSTAMCTARSTSTAAVVHTDTGDSWGE